MVALANGDIKSAINTLRRNKSRSVLTMLGVIIGVASVVTVVSIGEGIKYQVSAQTERLGKDLITIRPGQLLMTPTSNPLQEFGSLTSLSVGGSLNQKDVDVVTKTPGVADVAPLHIVSGGVTSGETKQHVGAVVIGTSDQFPKLLNQSMAYGSFLGSDDTASDKVVVGQHVAQELYDENVPLGQTLSILGHTFIVTGIFNQFQTAPLSVDADFNNAVFITSDAAQQITNDNAPIYEILVRPGDTDQTGALVNRLNGSLRAAHGGANDTTVLEQTQTLAVTSHILNLLTTLIGGVAAISLLVGGIGIMNVMLVSVAERMHEVGIRKAVGATNGQILSQFLTEATVLSISGGLIGIVLSLTIAAVLRLSTSLTPMLDWRVMAGAFVVTVGIGVLFGSVPALKAARKDPIAALRNE